MGILTNLAERNSERPHGKRVDGSGERNTDDNKDKVGDGNILVDARTGRNMEDLKKKMMMMMMMMMSRGTVWAEVGDGKTDDEHAGGVARLVTQRHGDHQQIADESTTDKTNRFRPTRESRARLDPDDCNESTLYTHGSRLDVIEENSTR